MGEPYIIGQACVDVVDRAGVQECPVQCIYELVDGQLIGKDRDGAIENVHPAHEELQYLYGDRMLYINPDECTSCDACVPVCPVNGPIRPTRCRPTRRSSSTSTASSLPTSVADPRRDSPEAATPQRTGVFGARHERPV